MATALIQLHNVRCHLNRLQQFQELSWTLQTGENWVFYGGNGCGKTALAKLVSGLLPISSGSRTLNETLDPRRDIQWVSSDAQKALEDHDHRFDDSETRDDAHDEGTRVGDIIFHGRTPSNDDKTWLDKLGMTPHLNRGIRYVSSGQLRKTLLLKAYADQPRVLIIDDPMAGLDIESQANVRELIQTIAESDTQLILLLRRRSDIVAGISHIAELADCKIVSAGPRPKDWEHQRLSDTHAARTFDLAAPQRETITAGTNLISMDKVTARYHDKVVFSDLSFALNAQQHCSVSGPNGCGKSTLIQIMNAENAMAYGQNVRLFGKKRGGGESIWEVKANFGEVSNRIHEQYGRGWTIQQVVISGLYDSIGLYKRPSNTDKARAKQCLSNFDINAKSDALYTKLSYGQQRLVLLARAIIKIPPILLLDEALTGLDDEHQEQFLHILDQVVRNTDTTVINITHRQEEQPRFIKHHWRFIANNTGSHDLVLSPA